MMQFIESVDALRSQIRLAREQAKKIVLVPTMGNLHEGHLQLIDIAKQHGEFVVCSIFVNPTQFGENEDFASYPRTLEADRNKLAQRQCDLLFFPSVQAMYPTGLDKSKLSLVRVPDVSEGLCGGSRPGHFDGVATVVSKLFNLVQPDVAVFGKKDFQQLAVIRKFTADLNFPVDIIAAPICRESSGLAMSSRNGYLNEQQKQQASKLYQLLSETKNKILAGNQDYPSLCKAALEQLKTQGFRPDYFEIYEANTLKPAKQTDTQIVILLAAFLDKTRLIDNISFELNT